VLDSHDVSKRCKRCSKTSARTTDELLLDQQKLDGRFRRIRVEVKRPDVDVRSRPGYLAPTEAEARAPVCRSTARAREVRHRRPSPAR
jgi:hypothetical protein